MNSNQKLLVLFASLLSLPTVVACGGSTEGVDPVDNTTPAPTASSSSSSASQGDAGAPSSNSGSPTADAGTSVATDAGSPTTLSANCSNLALSGPSLCVENVSGHAGEVVNLPIDLIETTGCTDALEADGHLVLNSSYFELVNPAQQIDCISRDLYAAPAPGTIEVMWDAFGPGQVQGCTADLFPGKLDSVQIEILPGTPSGDYDVTWSMSDLASSVSGCGMSNAAIGGTIHVD